MLVKTSELIDAALNFVVAKLEGHDVVVFTEQEQEARWFEYVPAEKLEKERAYFEQYIRPTLKPKIAVRCEDGYKRAPRHDEARMPWGMGQSEFQYGTSWLQAGPIIEKRLHNLFKLNKADKSEPDVWSAVIYRPQEYGVAAVVADGPTPLIAAMRCYCRAKLGDTVDIPDELIKKIA